MTPEQIELLENNRLYQLGHKSEVDNIRTRFAIQEKYALRITLIVFDDGSKVCRYGRDPVVEKTGIRSVAYPEVSRAELEELQNESTTLARVQAILDSLTHL